MQDSLIDQARICFEAAVRRVQADQLLAEVPWTTWLRRPLDSYRRVVLLGIGKASLAMAAVAAQQLGARLDEGAVVVPEGYAATLPDLFVVPSDLRVFDGGHPIPNAASVAAARYMLTLAGHAGADDLVLVLLSGGGSALCADFIEGVSLDEAQQTFRLLLESGADIHAVNTVRKHLSRVGGGRLAQAAAPAEVLTLAVSDVVGDALSVIASGPTVPDPTTFADARGVLQAFDLEARVPASVRKHLDAGLLTPGLETPKPEDRLFSHVRTEVIGRNRDALEAAAEAARARGYEVQLHEDPITGEARTVGRQLAKAALAVETERPLCLLWGGETTVNVQGGGRGGRNQELALAAALALEGVAREVVLLSGGTDGRDGPTPAAGAWATTETCRQARGQGLDPEAYLADNDTYTFFDALGGLLVTGPTHTNVMDVQIALVRPH